MSELCGLMWADVRADDIDDAEITFAWQVDRKGNRRPTKTDGSARTVPVPRELALVLARHKITSSDTRLEAFVFATRSGRPLGQRKVARALRKAEREARDEQGRPTFPVLHETDADGNPGRAGDGVVPSMHSFRHTVASQAQLAGELAARAATSSSAARAWTKSRSCLETETPPSRESSTSTKSQMHAAGRCGAHG